MKIIKIEANENGSHNNQESNAILPVIPYGWAVIPDDMSIPDSWPFVNITTEKITVDPEVYPISEGEEDQLLVVKTLTEGIKPEPEPIVEPTTPPSNEMLSAQVQAISDRQEFIEDCIAEMAMELYQN